MNDSAHIPDATHGPAVRSATRGHRAVAFSVLCVAVLVAAGCGSTIGSASLPLEQNFAECSRFGANDDVATVDCPDGELRILVAKPNVSAVHFVPLRFDERPRALRVTGTARATHTGLVWGLGCLASEPGQPAGAYVLLLANEGSIAIVRLGGGELADDGREAAGFVELASRMHAVRSPAARHGLQLTCAAGSSGDVRIRGSVDGRPLLTATDRHGFAAFTAALPIVFADRSGTDVRFDDVTAAEVAGDA